MLARVPIRAAAGLLLSQLLSVAFAQDDIDCRRRAADAFAYTRQVAGQSHDAKRWADTLNQQLLTLGITRESFRRCLPEGDVVLRKMEQCARNNDQVCAFTEKEVEEGNREIKQRAREYAEADAEIRARQQREAEAANSTATIKGNFAAACQSLDDARQVSTGLLFVGKYLADKLQTGECRNFSAGDVVDIFERRHFMSCIRGKFGDGSCWWISNRWFLYPLTYTENAVVLSAGAACYTLKNAIRHKFTVITVSG